MLTRSRAAVLAAALGLITATTATPAYADPANCYRDPATQKQVCEVTATPPTGPGSSSPGKGTSSGAKVTCEWNGQEVDCTSDEGTWSNARQCWVSLADPQPAADSALWEGNTDGAIYKCSPPSGGGGLLGVAWGTPTYFWADAAPPAVNPSALAREAVETMNLVGARVGATPLNPAAPGVVGIQTWLWIDGADEHSWGPNTATASSGGVTVSATAKATKVVWDMGDGTTVTCANPGTKWTPAKGDADSPTCGHTYLVDSGDQPDDAYPITATTHWKVQWSGAGQSGTITFTLTGPTRQIEVVELQALRTQ